MQRSALPSSVGRQRRALVWWVMVVLALVAPGAILLAVLRNNKSHGGRSIVRMRKPAAQTGSAARVSPVPTPRAARVVKLGASLTGDLLDTTNSPVWAAAGAHAKSGAGLLLFAYGSTSTLHHFLSEATQAARTFRSLNAPSLSIAIVTNNKTVDSRVFDVHLKPRADLLFAGDTDNGGQKRADKLPRQWLTRLLFLAHSPYTITWALDSNVISCTPNAASSFLSAALATDLWGFDIAHASQRVSCAVVYPHNFNIVFRWSPQTASLLRDWLLLQIRLGVAADDQKTLHLAELRHIAAGTGLKVGRITTPFAAAFYPIPPPDPASAPASANASTAAAASAAAAAAAAADRTTASQSSYRRITPVLRGRVHVLHATNASQCDLFNRGSGARQLLEWRAGYRTLGPTGNGSKRGAKGGGRSWNTSVMAYAVAATAAECEVLLGGERRYCLVGAAANESSAAADSQCTPPGIFDGYPFVVAARMEALADYVKSSRCGALCTEYLAGGSAAAAAAPPGAGRPLLYATACAPAVGRPLAPSLALHPVQCPPAHALSSFGLVTGEAVCADEGAAGTGHGRLEYACVRLGAPDDFPHSVHLSPCSEPRAGAGLASLAQTPAAKPAVRCPRGSALKSFELTSDDCAAAAAGTGSGGAPVGGSDGSQAFRFRYECIDLGAEAAAPREGGAWEGAGRHGAGGGAGGAGGGAGSKEPAAKGAGGIARNYVAASVCGAARGTFESLEGHQVSCAASSFVGGFALTTDGCEAVPVPGAGRGRALQARVYFACVWRGPRAATRGAWGGAAAVERSGMVEGDASRR